MQTQAIPRAAASLTQSMAGMQEPHSCTTGILPMALNFQVPSTLAETFSAFLWVPSHESPLPTLHLDVLPLTLFPLSFIFPALLSYMSNSAFAVASQKT